MVAPGWLHVTRRASLPAHTGPRLTAPRPPPRAPPPPFQQAKLRSIRLTDVVRVQQGQATPVFRRYPLPEFDSLSLSVIYCEGCGGLNSNQGGGGGGISLNPLSLKDGGKERSLDLICRSQADFDVWFWGLRLYSEWARGCAPAAPRGGGRGGAGGGAGGGAAAAPPGMSAELLSRSVSGRGAGGEAGAAGCRGWRRQSPPV